MKTNRCYTCYELTTEKSHFHLECLKKLFGTPQLPELNFNNKEIESMALELVKEKKGLPGVQKKLSLTLNDVANSNRKRLTVIWYLGGNYILKIPTNEYPFMCEVEDLTMHLASIAKFNVALHSLLPMQDKKLAYITKRFDRNGKKKIATEDLCQLSGKLSEQKYKSSYEKVGKVIYRYTAIPGEELLKFFELIVFSYIVGNADMHLKNFSLITEDISNIGLSPFYDLLATRLLLSKDKEELALPLNGKKQNIRKKDFIEFGKNLNIPEKVIYATFETMRECLSAWQNKIEKSFLSLALKEQYYELIKTRLELFSQK